MMVKKKKKRTIWILEFIRNDLHPSVGTTDDNDFLALKSLRRPVNPARPRALAPRVPSSASRSPASAAGLSRENRRSPYPWIMNIIIYYYCYRSTKKLRLCIAM